jgi:hypothetical protein
MNVRPKLLLLVLFSAQLLSCGGKKPPPSETGAEGAGKETEKEKQEAVEEAKIRIKDWLGKELTERMAVVGKELGKDVGEKLAADKNVLAKAKGLSDGIFKDEEVKKQVDKIADKATAGVGNKLTLGWKALTSGGVDAYKKKVKEDAKRVAMDALMDHLRDSVLRDPRMAKLLKDFSPALKLQTKVAAIALQENLSPKVTQKILAIALQISAETHKAEMASRMEKWVEGCEDHAGDEVEKLLRSMAGRKSMNDAVRNLAMDEAGARRHGAQLAERLGRAPISRQGLQRGRVRKRRQPD